MAKEPVENTKESLKDVFGALQEAIQDDPEVVKRRENRVAELETDAALKKFPREMSCVTAMDELMQCFSFGGQIRNYYRYGEVSLCRKQHEKLMFCLKTKLYSDEDREIAVARYFQKNFLEDCKKGSSEDIWQAR